MMVDLHPAFLLRARNYATRQQVELCPKYSSRVAGSQQYTPLLLKVIQEEENILPDNNHLVFVCFLLISWML